MIDRPSLFERLRRYARTPGRDAQEDRLTEALAATLEAAPQAARCLVSDWFGVEVSGKPTVRTQRHEGGNRIDLELLFDPGGRSERRRIWIESKVKSRPYREQGERYIRRLRDRGDPWCFSWLTADPNWSSAELPDGACAHTWQELAVVLRDSLRADNQAEITSDYGSRLVAEFVQHLEEEGLGYTEAFSKADADALRLYHEACARIEEVGNQALAILKARWGEPLEGDVRGSSPDRWWAFSKSPLDGPASPWPSYPDELIGEHPYFELHVRPDDARSARRGEWVVGAGATFHAPLASTREVERWLSDLGEEGFKSVPGDREYVFRYKSLSDLEGSDLGSQASALGEWTRRTFECLNRHPPPGEVFPEAG